MSKKPKIIVFCDACEEPTSQKQAQEVNDSVLCRECVEAKPERATFFAFPSGETWIKTLKEYDPLVVGFGFLGWILGTIGITLLPLILGALLAVTLIAYVREFFPNLWEDGEDSDA